jgi:hypothetical protein
MNDFETRLPFGNDKPAPEPDYSEIERRLPRRSVICVVNRDVLHAALTQVIRGLPPGAAVWGVSDHFKFDSNDVHIRVQNNSFPDRDAKQEVRLTLAANGKSLLTSVPWPKRTEGEEHAV